MGKYSGPSCRLCRREGIKLFLKGTKCGTQKCPLSKKAYAPGQHGQLRTKLSDYGIQLREKQRVKRIYGVFENQFRLYFRRASRSKGVTGEMLLSLLERRLDNVIFRLGFAASRAHARQMVRHGHVLVNQKKVNIPSYCIKGDDAIQIKGKEAFIKAIKDTLELTKDRGMPEWLSRDEAGLSAKIARLPERQDVGFPVREQLIVELYSK